MAEVNGNRIARTAVLMTCACDDKTMRALEEKYDLYPLWQSRNKEEFIARNAHTVRAIVTRGDLGADGALIRAFPHLEIIACYGVGTDAIDLAAARERGVRVTNTPDVLVGDVADLGIGLALAIMRNIPAADEFVRSGQWGRYSMPLVRRFFGCNLGIVGFGKIGRTIAKRAAAFDAVVGYFDVARNADSPHQFFPTLVDLAAWSDVLMVTLSGGESTRGLIDRNVLDALGPSGFLVNVSRGSVVDEAELLAALEANRIGGAGLDVFWHEPEIDQRFMKLTNTVLQPHHASATVETREEMGRLVCANLSAHFANQKLITPVV